MTQLKLLYYCVVLSNISAVDSNASLIAVHTEEFITQQDRTHFNGFELMPPIDVPPGWIGPYSEDDILVEQINGNNDIITTYNMNGGIEGQRCWYPAGGDHGYTRITRVSRQYFQRIGFHVSSGRPDASCDSYHLLYELWDGGVIVQEGSVPQQHSVSYLGFEGEGFDEIRLRDGDIGIAYFVSDGTPNALAIDSLEMSLLPEPTSISALFLGILVVLRMRRSL